MIQGAAEDLEFLTYSPGILTLLVKEAVSQGLHVGITPEPTCGTSSFKYLIIQSPPQVTIQGLSLKHALYLLSCFRLELFQAFSWLERPMWQGVKIRTCHGDSSKKASLGVT